MSGPNDGPAAKGTTRRSFLGRSMAAAATVPWLGSQLLAGGLGGGARHLVWIELSGGNDGLNTVVPFAHDRYKKARPTLKVAAEDALPLDEEFGLHPSLSGLMPAWEAGELGIVQGVGYDRPDRSHFVSRDIWHAARRDVEETPTSGWMGRAADILRARDPSATPAVAIGTREVPLALTGETHDAPVLRNLETFQGAPEGQAPRMRALAERTGKKGGDLDFLRRSTQATIDTAERMRRVVDGRSSVVEYPATALASHLSLAARLIAGGFPCSMLYATQEGYDTHAEQGGLHQALLRTLGDALAAFREDALALGIADRTLVVVTSEFGRRVQENGSRGTDHGAAGPVLLWSPKARGGLHGPRNVLDDLEEGDVRTRIDFRSLYASLLTDWLDVPATAVLGEEWTPEPILRG